MFFVNDLVVDDLSKTYCTKQNFVTYVKYNTIG